jgi:hypothetical protein
MFSGFYDAINPLLSSESSPSPRPPGGDPALDQTNGKPGEIGYSTYQRRTKPSLEDRLKASLAAKEQKRLAQEQGDSPISPASLPPMVIPSTIREEKQNEESDTVMQQASQSIESKNGEPASREAWNVPLPSSPPQIKQPPTDSSLTNPSLTAISSYHGGDVQTDEQVAAQTVTVKVDDTEPPKTPTKTQKFSPPRLAIADPLSPIPPATPAKSEASEYVQELTLPSPGYGDPLTPALLELEKEQQAAAARARLPRSPPPPSPQQKHHGRSKSAAINKSMVPEGEPFIRFGSSTLNSRPSLEQILKGTNAFEGLGLEGVNDVETLKEWIDMTRKKSEVRLIEVLLGFS